MTDPASHPLAHPDSAARLVSAAASVIGSVGAASASSRAIAAAADLSASAVNYNFGGLNALHNAAYRLGVERTYLWTLERLEAVRALAGARAGAAAFVLESTLDDWTLSQRELALLYQECVQHSGREGGAAQAWRKVWAEFWEQAAGLLGLAERAGAFMDFFFQAEALHHLINWRRSLDRAALHELAHHFAWLYLGAPKMAPIGAVAACAALLEARRAPAFDDASLRIAEAAVAVVNRAGLEGLTHRAVAAEAHVTLGAVAYHFRTAEDLIAAAARSVRAVTAQARVSGASEAVRRVFEATPQAMTPEQCMAEFAALLPSLPPPGLDAQHTLLLAAARRPSLTNVAAVSRYAYGQSSVRMLSGVRGFDRRELDLDAALLSRLIAGLWRYLEPAPEAERVARHRDWIVLILAPLFAARCALD